MNNIFKDTCLTLEKYTRFTIEDSAHGTVIVPDTSSSKETVCPFDNIVTMVCDYLTIGYYTDKGKDADEAVLSFVSKYGMPKKNMKRLNISEFCEDALGLYLHFTENAAFPYPDSPEWVLETEPVSALIQTTENGAVIEWQTPDLATATELAYTLLLCGNERRLGLCKHCGAPFKVKNPKAEFCSPSCRNRYNVYKSRNKN